ncbi:hypothetical protein BJ742DRAFT_796011 [Cladochytrium replicatum]|nr:hypothetical protein BJ742DRAFT_796011 [Cladochytrium replicatum]
MPTKRYEPIQASSKYFHAGRFIGVLITGALSVYYFLGQGHQPTAVVHEANRVCPQGEKIFPSAVPALEDIFSSFDTVEYRNYSARVYGNSIHYATESYDDMRANGVPPDDPRYVPFKKFHKYLESAFPLLHNSLKRELVNHHSLLYTWEGSEKSARPIILQAHQDVVPVNPETWNEWTHPPFSGYFDGEYVWGRGAADTKNSLIAILESIEVLLKGGFKPKKTILVVFGHDEEIGGDGGAAYVAETLAERYGPKSIEFILDEGGAVRPMDGNILAVIGTQEKGYADITVKVDVPGGHSSVPPDHTGIGILSRIVNAFEDAPFPITLTSDNALLTSLQCLVENGGKIDLKLAEALRDIEKNRELVKKLLVAEGGTRKFSLTTSQAIDVVRGGVKANALPESSYFLVNHRIQIDWSIRDVVDRHIALIQPIAIQFDLALRVVFAKNDASSFFEYRGTRVSKEQATKLASGVVTIEVLPASSEPLQATPLKTEAWKLISGTIRAVHEEDGEHIIVVPNLSLGNTDMPHMRKITDSTFNFAGGRLKSLQDAGGAHTVNEYMSINVHISAVKFYFRLIQNYSEL